jgi:[acyl-carrier-protein] S-malonyltransferase
MTTAAEIKEELGMQIMSCVRWSDSIRYMLAEDVRSYVEVGQGRVLASMMKRIDSDASISNISDMDSVIALAS